MFKYIKKWKLKITIDKQNTIKINIKISWPHGPGPVAQVSTPSPVLGSVRPRLEKFLKALKGETKYKSYKNIKTVSITTAEPISDQTKSEIMTYIKKTGGDEIELTEIVDEDIIGGVIIKMGDKQLDASVTRNIKELKKTFNKNLYIKDF